MERACYSIEKVGDQWVVSTRGARILICKRKKEAVMIVKCASEMLRKPVVRAEGGCQALACFDDEHNTFVGVGWH